MRLLQGQDTGQIIGGIVQTALESGPIRIHVPLFDCGPAIDKKESSWCQTAFQHIEHRRESVQAKIDKDEIHAIGKSRDKGITGTRMAFHQMVQTRGSQIALSRRGFFRHLIQRKNAASRVLCCRSQMQSGIAVRSAKFDQRPRPLVNRCETQIMRHLWAGGLEAQRISRTGSALLLDRGYEGGRQVLVGLA